MTTLGQATGSPPEPSADADGLSKGAVGLAHDRLRLGIVNGDFAPGSIVSQVMLAQVLQVGRTPLREAIRLLEREGWLEAELNKRVRVSQISVQDLEQVYALRISTEVAAVYLSLGRIQHADLAAMRSDLEEMTVFADADNYDRWHQPHEHFHDTLLGGAPERFRALAAQLSVHAERYRRAYSTAKGHVGWAISLDEHRQILEAADLGDPGLVAERLARHYARIALNAVTLAAPEYDPRLVREALSLAQRQVASTAPGAGQPGLAGANPTRKV